MSSSTAGSVRGRDELDVPVQMACEVLASRREGAYRVLSFAAGPIAARARPGQFVEIAVASPGSLLRRPFSIAGVSTDAAGAGSVEVVFDAHGPGTTWLGGIRQHDVLDVIGPLGTAFVPPPSPAPCLLVGGGYGAAPLYFLAEQLHRRQLPVDLIVGAASHERLMQPGAVEGLFSSVTFTTEDGSHGTRGRVTDVLADVAADGGSRMVYACGPNPMLRAVSERCGELELPVQVAVEERMACGIGVCFTCVLPIRGSDGDVGMQRSCLQGPVFDGARIVWEESRYAAGPTAAATGGTPASSRAPIETDTGGTA